MTKKSLFLIDATAFCYRAFYALSGLSTSSGQQTNAVYGFINILNKILKDQKPDYLVCCFDLSRHTFRSEKFAQYKMHRAAMPDGLISQIPIIKEVVAAYGIPIFEKEGFEADDLIAQLARSASSGSLPVTIVSSDKDILQLVDKHIRVFSPAKDSGVLYDVAKVKERFGVLPEQVVDVIALMGDAADNLPGVPGIGDKTAQKLIAEFGTVDKLLKNVGKVKPDKIKEMIVAHTPRIKLNKELITLDQELELDLDLKKAKTGQPDYDRLGSIFKKLEFKKLLQELPDAADKIAPVSLSSCNQAELPAMLKHCDEIVVYGSCLEDLLFAVKDKFFNAKLVQKEMRLVIADPRIKKTGHDLKKLKVALAKEGLVLNGLGFDTMIAAYLLNPSRSGYMLEDLALENLGEFIRPGSLGGQEALALLVRLKPALKQALEEKDLSTLFYELEMPLVSILAVMEQDGIKLDS
ncbi:MAG: 5'-3' exonuclease H3TH domain-containing protein, partial [Candidatus Omnitrophica bacterium]|nr:5'-3' exonuclease H3TH domain-containing protein [Candidatus Omnitrophota bacterium]